MDGVLVVDKPEGMTSHDIVKRVRRLSDTRRIGHLGTLDPMATGVLPLVIGKATRLATLLSAGKKIYEAVIRLGVVTDTYDTTGEIVVLTENDRRLDFDAQEVEAVRRRFIGTFSQNPPPFSAKKIGGIRAYRLARQRRPVEPRPVDVTVYGLELTRLDDRRLACRVTCGSGFYMRSLAHDVGAALGPGGCLERLRRLQSGAFSEDAAVKLDRLERQPELAAEHLLALEALLPELATVVVNERGRHLAAHGNTLGSDDIESWTTGERPGTEPRDLPVRVLSRAGELLAVAEETLPGTLRPRIVLV